MPRTSCLNDGKPSRRRLALNYWRDRLRGLFALSIETAGKTSSRTSFSCTGVMGKRSQLRRTNDNPSSSEPLTVCGLAPLDVLLDDRPRNRLADGDREIL